MQSGLNARSVATRLLSRNHLCVQRKSDGGNQEKPQQPEAEQEADVELEEEDYALLAEFGDRIDFLTGERAASLVHDPAATPKTPKKRCAPTILPPSLSLYVFCFWSLAMITHLESQWLHILQCLVVCLLLRRHSCLCSQSIQEA